MKSSYSVTGPVDCSITHVGGVFAARSQWHGNVHLNYAISVVNPSSVGSSKGVSMYSCCKKLTCTHHGHECHGNIGLSVTSFNLFFPPPGAERVYNIHLKKEKTNKNLVQNLDLFISVPEINTGSKLYIERQNCTPSTS